MPSDVKSSTESIDSADNPPKRVAVVDIGATAIRMAIAEIHESGEIRTLDTLTQAVTLGKDTFTTNSIDPATTEQCVRVLKSYRKKLREFDIARRDRIHVVATSAVREASNRHSFLERIYVATGFRVEPFDEAGVNRVMYMGVQPLLESRPELAGAQALIIEVGGGSTEVLLIHAGDVAYANIHRLGALRARKTLESVHAPATKVREIMEGQIHRIVAHVRPHVDSDKPLVMITLGGDVRFAASELLRVDELPALATIPLPRFRKFTNDILALSVDELVHKHRLPFPEAEAVGPALLAYAQIAKALGLEAIHVSTISLRDGLIKAMATHEAWTTDFAKQIIRSAIDVGRRFKFDEAHSLHVADLSQALFHALRNEHKLDSRCEIILHVAALLHDIGYVVNTRSHHKHSMYLIINGDLFGLSKRDVLLAALTARYHRRASPKPSHVEYASLDWVSRMNVAKMAAILRVADALDRSNTQRIKNITCSLEDGRLVISVPSADDLSLEQLAMQQKSTLFKEIFGVRVLLRNAPEL
ncbi:MAG: HD domain-containing protein [Planctomycetes bacterium]|nr:HD domain-containing protein [Planctomycetota bacterium]MBL7039767.1 HD domain-containing protein [Pirellulaceae bacterium]